MMGLIGADKKVTQAGVTNYAINSEDFTNASWNLDGANANLTRTADQTAAPTGPTTADKLTLNGGATATTGYIGHAEATLTAPYCASCYLKKAEYVFGMMSVGSFIGGYNAIFNLNTGIVSTGPAASGTSAGIEALADGWYRCYIACTNLGGGEFILITTSPANDRITAGLGGSGIYAWGAQLEIGVTTPSAYNPA